jgi:hypothetical protein
MPPPTLQVVADFLSFRTFQPKSAQIGPNQHKSAQISTNPPNSILDAATGAADDRKSQPAGMGRLVQEAVL